MSVIVVTMLASGHSGARRGTRFGRTWWVGASLLGLSFFAPAFGAAQSDPLGLEGVWTYGSLVPFQRPEEFADKASLTPDEAAAYVRRRVDELNFDWRDDDDFREHNSFWYEIGDSLDDERRTSRIVDPPDGRIPARTPAAQARARQRVLARRSVAGPEDRGSRERCIVSNSGPPMRQSTYNNNMQLFQTNDHVVILNEMVHASRIIPLDGSAHLPANVRQWMGDSRGRWDGNTLVVDTRNFTDKTTVGGSGPELHLVERFTRVDADTLLYEYTVSDPASFERPWSVRVAMKKSDGPIFEYACHEGNYSMVNVMAGARADEERRARGLWRWTTCCLFSVLGFLGYRLRALNHAIRAYRPAVEL